jgi:glycosyl transferase family 25
MFANALYINLKERTDRLEHLMGEFHKMGIENAIRIDAVRNNVGAIGCTLSHIIALETAKERDWEHVFICEDDITFLNPRLLREQSERFFANKELDWDVVVIGGNNCPPYTIIDDYCCRVRNCQTTTGYVVRKHYYNVLIHNFRESAEHLMREPHNGRIYALDIYWKRLQQMGDWYMILPLTVTQYENYSDIEKKTTQYDWLMLDMEKKWLQHLAPKRK